MTLLNDDLEFMHPDETDDHSWDIELVQRIRQDALVKIGFDPANMSKEETRFVVSSYYGIQGTRLQIGNRLSALKKTNQPKSSLEFVFSGMQSTENNVKKILAGFSKQQKIGQWAESIPGIGPVLSAGLIAHIDITKAPTVGHIWRFAGLDPTSKWLGNEGAEKLVTEVVPQRDLRTAVSDEQIAQIATLANKRADMLRTQALNVAKKDASSKITKGDLVKALAKRPYNADLKLLCWKIGSSFVPVADKVTQKGPDIYGKVYKNRKLLEIQRNENGDNAQLASEKLPQFRRETPARTAYRQGMLPKGEIQNRAQRYAAKLFLAHWHHVAYELEYNAPPPKPYIIDKGGHAHYIAPPHWPFDNDHAVCDCPSN